MFDIRPTLDRLKKSDNYPINDILSILQLNATKHGMVYFTTLQRAFTFNYETHKQCNAESWLLNNVHVETIICQ